MNIYAPIIPGKLCRVSLRKNLFIKTDSNAFVHWHSPNADNPKIREIIKQVQAIFNSTSYFMCNIEAVFDFIPKFSGSQRSLDSAGAAIALAAFDMIVENRIGFKVDAAYSPLFNNVCITAVIADPSEPADSGKFIAPADNINRKFDIFYNQLYRKDRLSCFIFCDGKYESGSDLLKDYFKKSSYPPDLDDKVLRITDFRQAVNFLYSREVNTWANVQDALKISHITPLNIINRTRIKTKIAISLVAAGSIIISFILLNKNKDDETASGMASGNISSLTLGSNIDDPHIRLYTMYLRLGNSYYNKKNFKRAIEEYSRAIQINSKYPDVFNQRGITYIHMEKYKSAIEDFDRAIKLNPDFAIAYYNRGVAYDKLNKPDQAIQDYIKAIKLDRKNAKAYNNLGRIYYLKGEYKTAVEYFSEAVSLRPDYSEAYYFRGRSYKKLNQDALAEIDFSHVNEEELIAQGIIKYEAIGATGSTEKVQQRNGINYKDPDKEYSSPFGSNEGPVSNWGSNDGRDKKSRLKESKSTGSDKKTLDRIKEARDDTGIIAKGGGGKKERFAGGKSRNEKGYGSSDFDYEAGYPDKADEFYYKGLNYFSQGDYDSAISCFNKSIELNPDRPGAYDSLEEAYKLKGDNKSAAETHKRLLAQFGDMAEKNTVGAKDFKADDYELFFNNGTDNLNKGKYEVAITDFNKSIELNPAFINAYVNRGAAYNNLKQYKQAIEDFSKAIELDPNYIYPYVDRGAAYNNLKQYKQAIEDFNKAIELNPEPSIMYIIYVNRGITFYGLKKYEQGIQDFNKAIEINATGSEIYVNRGWYYWITGNYEKAFDDYNTAIKLNKEQFHPYLNLALYYTYYKKDRQKSLEYFEKAFSHGCDPYAESMYKTSPEDDGYYMKDIINDPDFIKLQQKYKKSEIINPD